MAYCTFRQVLPDGATSQSRRIGGRSEHSLKGLRRDLRMRDHFASTCMARQATGRGATRVDDGAISSICSPEPNDSQELHFSPPRTLLQMSSEMALIRVANWENVQQRFTADRSNDTALLVVF